MVMNAALYTTIDDDIAKLLLLLLLQLNAFSAIAAYAQWQLSKYAVKQTMGIVWNHGITVRTNSGKS